MSAPSDLEPQAFETFLLWLSSDRDQALKLHDSIMRAIVRYFIRKGCPDPEELASEVRERVIKIIAAGDEYPIPNALFYSVAKNVWKEYLREPKPEPMPVDDPPSPRDNESQEKELLAFCLEKCLARLESSERDLITRYYQGERGKKIKGRKGLAAEHGGENNLRIKAFRIRRKLGDWMRECIGNHSGTRGVN